MPRAFNKDGWDFAVCYRRTPFFVFGAVTCSVTRKGDREEKGTDKKTNDRSSSCHRRFPRRQTAAAATTITTTPPLQKRRASPQATHAHARSCTPVRSSNAGCRSVACSPRQAGCYHVSGCTNTLVWRCWCLPHLSESCGKGCSLAVCSPSRPQPRPR